MTSQCSSFMRLQASWQRPQMRALASYVPQQKSRRPQILPSESIYSPVARTVLPAEIRSAGVQDDFLAAPAGLAADDLEFVFEESKSSSGSRAANGEETMARRSGAGSGSAMASALQARLSKAATAGHVLEAVKAHVDQLDHLHAATALHRLARFSSRGAQEAQAFEKEPLKAVLLRMLSEPGALEQLSSQGRCCVLWALARLRLAPPWLPRLLSLCAEAAPSLSGHQLTTALHSLVKLQRSVAIHESQQVLLEALHQELRRRRQSLGPGGTSAMDTVLIADSLARLQVKDDELFAALAAALRSHLEAGELSLREVRHVTTAFMSAGVVDATLTDAICEWLLPHVVDASVGDLVAVSFALARSRAAGTAQARLFEALSPEVLKRLRNQQIGGRDAASFIYSFFEVGKLSDALLEELTVAVARAPEGLNGQDLAIMVPCLGGAIRTQPALLEILSRQTSRCAKMLSPRQLARLMVGFGQARASSASLWDVLGKESLTRASYFSTPDVLRVLAGLDAAGVTRQDVLRTFWSRAATKQAKFLGEEALTLLQMWPRLASTLQREFQALPIELMRNLRTRLERSTMSGWRASPEFGVDLLEWLPLSRELQPGKKLDTRLVHAALRQLPWQVLEAAPEVWERMLDALALNDTGVLVRARVELRQQMVLRHTFNQRVSHLTTAALTTSHFSTDSAVKNAYMYAALGFDGPAMKELLRALIRTVEAADDMAGAGALRKSADLCWACAELRTHKASALRLTAKAADASGDSDSNGIDIVSWIRFAWASLALGGPDPEVSSLLRVVQDVRGTELVPLLGPTDVRPAQQVAWHRQHSHHGEAGHWAQAVLQLGPGTQHATAAEQELSTLLQAMRVPHVVASATAAPGGIYRVPVWFPQPGAVLDVDVGGDRLASGAIGGSAELRRQQLRSAGLRVLTMETASLRGTSKAQRLRMVAQAVAGVCPEAADWLATQPVIESDLAGDAAVPSPEGDQQA